MATATVPKNASVHEILYKRMTAAVVSSGKSKKVKQVTIDSVNPSELPTLTNKPRVVSGAVRIFGDQTTEDDGTVKSSALYSPALGLWGYRSDFDALFKRPELVGSIKVLEATLISKQAYNKNTAVHVQVSMTPNKSKIVVASTLTKGARDYLDEAIKTSSIPVNVGYELFAKAAAAVVNIVPHISRKGSSKSEPTAEKKTRSVVTNVVDEIAKRFANGKRSDISRLEMKTRQKGTETHITFIGMKPLPKPSASSTSRPISTIPLGDSYPGVVVSTSVHDGKVDETKRAGVINGVAILLASKELSEGQILTEAMVNAKKSRATKVLTAVIAAFQAEKDSLKAAKVPAKGGKKGKAGKKAAAAKKTTKKPAPVPKVVEVVEDEEEETEDVEVEVEVEVEEEEVVEEVKAPVVKAAAVKTSPLMGLSARTAALKAAPSTVAKRNATPKADESEEEEEESGSEEDEEEVAPPKKSAVSPPATSPSPTSRSPNTGSPQPVMALAKARTNALSAAKKQSKTGKSAAL